jgi:hypothetical protein
MTTPESVNILLGKSLRNRALVANALCAIAEEEAHAGDVWRAVETIRAIRGVMGEVSLILQGDVEGIPRDAIRDTCDLLSGLDGKIEALEKALTVPHPIH